MANPQPTGVGEGVQGAQAPWQGVWGMCPQNKIGGESPTSATPPRVGPKTPANPKPTGVGKTGGPGGASPLAGGVGVVPPQRQKRERVAHISEPAPSGTKNAGEPSAYGGGQRGSRGRKPPWRGAWEVSPRKTKRGGELPPLATPPRVGPKTPANPQPTGVGKGGVQGGEAPMAGGMGDVPPKF